MLLKTAMSRLMSRILAINRYMDIVMGVTQWPEIPLKSEYIVTTYRGCSGWEGGREGLTRNTGMLWWILAAGRIDIVGKHLAVQHKVGLIGDLCNDKLKTGTIIKWQLAANKNNNKETKITTTRRYRDREIERESNKQSNNNSTVGSSSSRPRRNSIWASMSSYRLGQHLCKFLHINTERIARGCSVRRVYIVGVCVKVVYMCGWRVEREVFF